MGIFGSLLFPWGILLQAFAIVHFIRRRPDTYWLYIILFLGPIGAIVYLFAEAAPDFGLLRQSFKVFPRRKRIRELESAVLDNPSAGNYEELADLYMEDGNFQRAEDMVHPGGGGKKEGVKEHRDAGRLERQHDVQLHDGDPLNELRSTGGGDPQNADDLVEVATKPS